MVSKSNESVLDLCTFARTLRESTLHYRNIKHGTLPYLSGCVLTVNGMHLSKQVTVSVNANSCGEVGNKRDGARSRGGECSTWQPCILSNLPNSVSSFPPSLLKSESISITTKLLFRAFSHS